MTIAEKINASVNNLKQKRTAIINAIQKKGVEISNNAKFAELPAKIEEIQEARENSLSLDVKSISVIEGIKPFLRDHFECISLPKVEQIGEDSFRDFKLLKFGVFPKCISIETSAFYNCISLSKVELPQCTSVGGTAFYNCTSLSKVELPQCTSVGGNAFYNCEQDIKCFFTDKLRSVNVNFLKGYNGSKISLYTPATNVENLKSLMANQQYNADKWEVLPMSEEEFKAQFLNN